MKSDLNRLMEARGLSAIYIPGAGVFSPLRAYLCNGVDIHYASVLQKRGGNPVLFVGPMERQEAAKTGLEFHTLDEFGWADILKQTEGNRDAAFALLWGRLLKHFGVPAGKIGLYGLADTHVWVEQTRRLNEAYPDYPIVGETGTTLFDEAFATKDAGEIALLKDIGKRTSAVLKAAWDYISSCHAAGEAVIKPNGTPMTIGDVKRFVRRELLDRDLEDTDMIFAQGTDGGYPHSRGEDTQALQLGQPIVFDLFPRQVGGGYFHDCTRTWSIGYAKPDVQALYDQVRHAFDLSCKTYAEPGQPYHTLQDAVQDYYEANGHPTARNTPGTAIGYMHSLGHGLGLNIHERPSLSHLVTTDVAQVGNVFTIEPGLYYPDQGMGARIEDTVMIDADGSLVHLTDFPYDLVLPLKG